MWFPPVPACARQGRAADQMAFGLTHNSGVLQSDRAISNLALEAPGTRRGGATHEFDDLGQSCASLQKNGQRLSDHEVSSCHTRSQHQAQSEETWLPQIGVGCILAGIQAEDHVRRIHATTDVILCCTIERQSSKTLANSWCFPSSGARQRSACMEGEGGGRQTQRRSSGLLKRRWVRRRTGSCVHNGKGDVRRCSIPAGSGGTGSRVHVGKERRHERCSTSRQAADMHLPSWCFPSLRTRTLQCSARNDRNMSSILRTLVAEKQQAMTTSVHQTNRWSADSVPGNGVSIHAADFVEGTDEDGFNASIHQTFHSANQDSASLYPPPPPPPRCLFLLPLPLP